MAKILTYYSSSQANSKVENLAGTALGLLIAFVGYSASSASMALACILIPLGFVMADHFFDGLLNAPTWHIRPCKPQCKGWRTPPSPRVPSFRVVRTSGVRRAVRRSRGAHSRRHASDSGGDDGGGSSSSDDGDGQSGDHHHVNFIPFRGVGGLEGKDHD